MSWWGDRAAVSTKTAARTLAASVLAIVFASALGSAHARPALGGQQAGRPGRPFGLATFGLATFVLAIDAGHGGSNLGAAGITVADLHGIDGSEAGRTIFEKQVTLALARRLRSQLASRRDVQVVLCREDDVMLPIRARARCAEEAGADLFISLHANASPPGVARGTRRGFEVYVLSPQEREDDASLAAARAAADPAEAVWAMHEALALAERSILAARLIAARLGDRLGRDANRGIRQTGASLDVLRGAGAPSALVEVGFIDHPGEGQLLSSPTGQDVIAAALAAAVLDFAQR